MELSDMTKPKKGGTKPGRPPGVALPPGFGLGHYRLLKQIGGGGFGLTYLGKDTHTGREVVIKECLPSMFATRDPQSYLVQALHRDGFAWALRSFREEAALLAKLRHRNIVTVSSYFSALNTEYYVMPSVGGQSLKERLQRPMGIHERIELASKVQEAMLDALEYIHSFNILHRDIKPDNILLDSRDTPILIDFGAAREQVAEKTMTVIGTPGFAPIEQMQQHAHKGPWTDIYALGATLYNVLTDTTPVNSADRIGDKYHSDPLVPLVRDMELCLLCDKRVLRCIDRAMGVFAENRWQSVAEWRRGLQTTEKEEKRRYVPQGSRYWRHALSMRGRLSPARYWGGTFVLLLLWAAAASAFFCRGGLNNVQVILQWEQHLPLLIAAAGACLPFLLVHFCTTARRLHDADFSAMGTAFLFIPVLGWLYLFFLCLHPGTPGANTYGNSPHADDYPPCL